MLPTDTCGSIKERPEYKAEQSLTCLLFAFIVKVSERLLHRPSHLFNELARVAAEQFPVKGANFILVLRHEA